MYDTFKEQDENAVSYLLSKTNTM